MIKDYIHNFNVNDIVNINHDIINFFPYTDTKYTKPWKIINHTKNKTVFHLQSLFDNSIITMHYTIIQPNYKYMRNLKIKKINENEKSKLE